MKKEDLVDLLTRTLSSAGFKRKGNNWVNNSGEVSKVVNLQKSEFSNSYYLNYGYVIKTLQLDGTKMHIYLRLSTKDGEVKDSVSELLDLSNDMPDSERYDRLHNVIFDILLSELGSINTEEEIKQKILDGTWQHIVPISVRKYFQITQITQ